MVDLALYGGKSVSSIRFSYGHQYMDGEDIQAVTGFLTKMNK